MVLKDVHKLRSDVDNLKALYDSMEVYTEYYVSNSDVSVPPVDGEWLSERPAVGDGDFLWSRNIINTGKGLLKTEPLCISISENDAVYDVDVEYIVTSSRFNVPAQNDPLWSSEAPLYEEGDYVWTRTKVVSPLETKYSPAVCITGYKGEDGKDGENAGVNETGIMIVYDNSIILYLNIRFSDTNNPQSIEQIHLLPQGRRWFGLKASISPAVLPFNSYRWSVYNENMGMDTGAGFIHLKFAYSENGDGMNSYGGSYRGYYITDENEENSDNPSDYTWERLVGKSIIRIIEKYASSYDYINPPASHLWSITPQPYEEGKFYWTKSEIQYSDGTTEDTNPICISGLDGESVHYIYCLCKDSTPPTLPANDPDPNNSVRGTWTEDPLGVNGEWLYEFVAVKHKVDNVWGEYSVPSVWAKFGEKGETGATGESPTSEQWDKINEVVSGNFDAITVGGYDESSLTKQFVGEEYVFPNINGSSGSVSAICWGKLVRIDFDNYYFPVTSANENSYANSGLVLPEDMRPSKTYYNQSCYGLPRIRISENGNIAFNFGGMYPVGATPLIGGQFYHFLPNELRKDLSISISNTLINVSTPVCGRLYETDTNVPVVGKLINILLNGVNYTRMTDENGEFNFVINTRFSNFIEMVVSVKSDISYNGVSKTVQVSVNRASASDVSLTESNGKVRLLIKGYGNQYYPFKFKKVTVNRISSYNIDRWSVTTDENGYVNFDFEEGYHYNVEAVKDEKMFESKDITFHVGE